MSTALLLSGGMDSVAIAWWRRPEIAVTIDYGQRAAAAEVRAAAAVCAELGIEHLVQRVDLAALGSGDMAGRPRLAEAPVPEWWPFRNQMLVTLAAMAVIPRGARRLLIGCLATDGAHADGRAAFVEAMDGLLAMQEGGMRLEAPAIGLTAVELIRASGVPPETLAWAHSCHVAEHACGMCRGCQKHYETLEALGHAPY
ncbi:7-cyano-7-deazaguanine synthase [Roseicella frigidaeris]|uniref:7-cyano-7-deazaguanine synthase n=1 Tax=Roseicella frigidaeris TaxID=2230885 RepID=A0A327LV08_9PROT|nr:7-cyano-7-deazaguanine synthase [Roseicella frigidaeris]RAI54650.1 7-cyano-7-deazaguanine synthase [Roseicella frigidaeris]